LKRCPRIWPDTSPLSKKRWRTTRNAAAWPSDAIATGLALNLKLAGRSTAIARDGDEALRLATDEDFELILLDINLPRKNGLEVLSALRAADNLVPVVVLSARGGEFDKVAALRLGADDYVTKPFALAELLARIDAVLRRAKPITVAPVEAKPDSPLAFDDVAIDLAQRVVTRAGVEVKLTHTELELLAFFVRHPSQVFSRDQLFQLVWGQSVGSVRTVDNFVGQLRKRFEGDPEQPRHFITIRGSGYRFRSVTAMSG